MYAESEEKDFIACFSGKAALRSLFPFLLNLKSRTLLS